MKKFRRNAVNDIFIDGSDESMVVADDFAKHFSVVYNTATATSTDVPGIQSLLDSLPGTPVFVAVAVLYTSLKCLAKASATTLLSLEPSIKTSLTAFRLNFFYQDFQKSGSRLFRKCLYSSSSC